MADNARDLWNQGDVDGAGAALGLPKVTIEGGHPFDESDESYKRRVHAALDGAEAAGATAPIEDDPGTDDADDEGADDDESAAESDADDSSTDNGAPNP